MFGLESNAFWLLIGAPAVIIGLMFIGCLKVKREDRD